MNKGKLEKFAVDSRRELIAKIKIKAMQYGIEEDKIKKFQVVSNDSIIINGKPLSNEEKTQREQLLQKISYLNEKGEDGYEQIVEEVTYTWFNRFTALRFMEVNNYLPTRVRALSSETPGNVEPDLIKEANNVDLPVDNQKIYDMKLNNDIEGLFKYLIIAQCNALNKSLPFMFEKIGHYTELLFPDGLLNDNAFIRNLTNTDIIPEEDWQQVEIIGWLYQYYNSEEKDRVIKAKKKYKKEEIPFATQLFTPDWIVRYMVQNTLGRYWIESHPEHIDLKKNWEFYLENPNSEPDFEDKLAPYINKELKVEEIKCFDPAMGSGHILVYMFDVLYEIYERCGYMSKEIPQLIIENNLYGLDIDDRAYQLACFAVIMKGMKYNNRLLRSIQREAERTGGEGIKLNLASIQETNNLNDMDIKYIAGKSSGENYDKVKAFIEQFRDAKIYGSLIEVEGFDEGFLKNRLDYIKNNPVETLEDEPIRLKVKEILAKIINQANIMMNIYDVLVTNPPYIGIKYMDDNLKEFVGNKYTLAKYDLFSVFMEYSFNKTKKTGQVGMMTPFVWMFTFSYNELRKYIIDKKGITSLVQLEFNAFPEACVQVCTFTMRNYILGGTGEYIRLSNFTGSDNQPIKTLEAIKNPAVDYRYSVYNQQFKRIEGNPIGYWLSENEIKAFEEGIKLEEIGEPKSGLMTGNNDEFLRLWYEVDYNKIGFNMEKFEDINIYAKKWFPYHKGGEFRKWYGNIEYLINMENEGYDIKHSKKNTNYRLRDKKLYFKEGLTWSDVNSSYFGVRYSPKGFLFDMKGSMIFVDKDYNIKVLIGILCSKIIAVLIKVLNPTISFQVNDIKRLPILRLKEDVEKEVEELVNKNIMISKDDWDSYETSWDFNCHPIMKAFNSYKECKLRKLVEVCLGKFDSDFKNLKLSEERLNEIFIELYGLKNEITPNVEDEYITLKSKSIEQLIKTFVSYAVGCIFGRYSLNQDGLVYAGGKFDTSKYTTFKVDEDNIIPILSDSYFEEDIVTKFVEFVKVTFGEETLSENLEYIAETLGKKSNETAKETIRRYFLTDFYKEHLQTYKNRPIYWMFTSGKQRAFNCLIYMHRYDKTTLSRIRTDYLHELQDRLDTEKKALVDVVESNYSTKEKREAKKKLNSIDKQIEELKKYDEVLHHMADMQIEIDLDDGVKANYEKFKGLLAKIK
ncbi:BREX-1 system adenine-specific DNA-methyltransferase PglX [Clostridium guangxiense]|uniref:BREX-1 system adenine-specific DNA-methyltransferase PglX n=1 Tax=Clostridium guangxiense TaxID=1662055 RepID=UPI001E634B68|nr:BREX-1 system adenine-specific DNA-methyltransferase PglX [Clostridium guangxiense]MCD2347233.1 BREX-1 system adenine-specific DNA-methyltransferase PglX [Clostridium guangxiense]